MWTNSWKTSLRTLRRERGYAALNVVGLAIGVAAFALIFLYIHFEISYDEFHEKADRIVRVTNGDELETPYALGPALSAELPEVEKTVRVERAGGSLLNTGTRMRHGEKAFYEDNLLYVDSTFFEVFDFTLAQGDPGQLLNRPFTIVLTEQLAAKYFGQENPIGKTIEIGSSRRERTYEVTGVVEDPPPNTHLPFSAIASFQTLGTSAIDRPLDSWGRGSRTYVLLEMAGQRSSFAAEVRRVAARHVEEDRANEFGVQPLPAIHVGPYFEGEIVLPANPTYLYVFGSLALLLLLLAGVNYVNLATARAARRAEEVGIRKVAGSSRGHIVGQFLGEALIVGLLAGILACGLVRLGIPALHGLTGAEVGTLGASWFSLLITLGGGLLVGCLAGLYPALVLSGLNPTAMLRGRSTSSSAGASIRKALVVGQFAISIAFIAATLIIRAQVGFMQSKDVGLSEDQVIMLTTRRALGRDYPAFKQELERYAEISSVTGSVMNFPVQRRLETLRPFRPEGMSEQEFQKRQKEGSLTVHPFMVASDFTQTLGISMAEGRSLEGNDTGRDSMYVLVNQTAADQFGWKNPIGKELHAYAGTEIRVVGVTEDFHYRPLDQHVQPLVLMRGPPQIMSFVMVRFEGGDTSRVLEILRDTWSRFGDGTPLPYSFLDQRYEQVYVSQQHLADMTGSLALVALVLASMGLFGLASYSASQRSKEISIRKVVGATTARVAAHISGDFMKLVGLGYLVAVPVTAVLMRRWLTDFAYRITLRPWEFLVAGSFVLLVALVAVGYQSVKAALTNPADSLRYE